MFMIRTCLCLIEHPELRSLKMKVASRQDDHLGHFTADLG